MVNDYQQNNQVHYNQWGAVNAGLMQNINTCDYLSTQNALLYNVAASACIEIDNLTNRLNSVMNTDVLRNEWLSEGKEGLLYNVKKNSDIKDEIESTADSPVIIDARGCDFGNYKPKVNLECVKDMVAFDRYIEIGGTRMGIQAPVIILSNELGYTLDPELFFEIEICSDDINAKIVETLYKYKEQLGDLIVEFLKHMEDIDIKSWLMNRDVYAKDVQKICSDTYKALSIAISLFESFISKKYDMDINSLLNIKYDWQKYLNAYFNKSIDDVKGVISLFQEKIYDAVKDERLIEKYDNCISDVDTMDKYIFILGDEVCIRHNAIMNIIIPDMNIGIKSRHLLKYLDKANMLVMNRNGYECKRVMCYSDGNKRQEAFVIIKRKYYKTDKTEETATNERKNRYKTEEQDYWNF